MKFGKTLGFLASASAVAVATPGLAAQAFAADVAAEEQASEGGDAAIIVTARKREENLIDVPLPVTVATQAQLQRDQVYSITDLQRTTASL